MSSLPSSFLAHMVFYAIDRAAKRKISPKLKELREFEKLPREAQLKMRNERLFALLKHAQASIPYYQDLFRFYQFTPEKVLKDVRYLNDLPLLTKQLVRENIERIRLPAAQHARKTGGSTGQSVFFYYDDEGLDWTSAINLRSYEMAGKFLRLRDAHISSKLDFVPTYKEKFFECLKNFALNRRQIFIRSFSEQDLKTAFEQLLKAKPYLLQGHPSSGYALATYIKELGLEKRKYAEIFEPSGEMLTPKIVDAIEANLGCKVVNRYGNAEFGVIAHSRLKDPPTNLKIFDRAFYVEETFKDNLIVTGLTNYSMPLIRYDTGDIGTVKVEEYGTFLSDLQGRIHDRININGEDYPTHFLMDYLDHRIRGVREFQFLTQIDTLPILQVVPEKEEDGPRIVNEIKERWPIGLNVVAVKYEALKRIGWQYKFRHVIDLNLVQQLKPLANMKAVLFDMDGVLYDSMKFHALSWIEAMKAHGIAATQEEFYLHEGRTGAATVDLLIQKFLGRAATPAEVREIHEKKIQWFDQNNTGQPIPYAAEFLKKVKSQGLTCVLVTGSTQKLLIDKIETDFPGVFSKDKLVTGFDVQLGKPDPEPYLKGLVKAGGLAPHQAVVIENAPLGIEAAKSAGCFVIAINTGLLPDQQIWDSGADIVFPSMRELFNHWDSICESANIF